MGSHRSGIVAPSRRDPWTAPLLTSLVERGELGLDTTARSVLGDDLALIDDRITVEQLLARRSGIGDYLHENEVDD